jgi:PAS domain S-box-containing protein
LKLQDKTILTVVVVVGLCSVALYIISSIFLTRSYERLENDDTQRDLSRVSNAINDRLVALGNTTLDWAVWDESYNFVLNRDNKYIESNLSDDSFANAGFDLMAYYDNSSQLIFYKVFDGNGWVPNQLTPHDQSVLNRFILNHFDFSNGPMKGLINLDSGALMAAANPIFNNNRDQSAGTLICGSFLDAGVLQNIAHSTHLELTMQPFSSFEMRGISGEPLSPGLFTDNIYINKNQARFLNAYEIINDYAGQPCLIVQTTIAREVYIEGRNTIAWMHIIIAGLSLVYIALTSALIYQLIIIRVKRLTAGLQIVSTNNDLTVRIPATGKDEISILTQQTNSTLDQIAKAQEELKASEERFRQISEVTQDVIYQLAVKPELKLEFISISVEKTLGYTVSEIEQNPDWVMQTILSEDRAKLLDLIASDPLTSTTVLVLRWVHKDGHVVWLEHVNSIVWNSLGQPVKVIGAGRDITERISMEENRIAAYQREKEIRQELEKESQARAFFIDVLGHELRTPMTPLLISMDILVDQANPELTPLQAKLIGNAANSVKLLSTRLDELLDLTRFLRGTFRLNYKTMDAGELLTNAVEQFRPALISRRQTLKVDIMAGAVWIKADPFRLQQVILNLLSNASKFSEDDQEIIFKATITNGVLEVEVEDHGCGLTSEEQQRLFEPYHRVEQDRQKFAGLGLGLAVSRQIIEAHGGHLSVTSEVRKGSIFKFTIPLDSGPDSAP